MPVLKIPDGFGGYIPVRAPSGKFIEIRNDGTVTDTKKIYLIDENGVKTEITKQMFNIIT